MEYDIDPASLRDARINEVHVESDKRLLLHLRDGRAVAITATHINPPDSAWAGPDSDAHLTYELVNP